ncbi:MAG: EamA family transporter [Actinomycetaceae bacterium]|nr:EamA family transporter [Actinomycetaceae bacterium]
MVAKRAVVVVWRAGEHFRGLAALPIGRAIGALAVAPIALTTAGTVLFEPPVLLAGAAVALLSSALPYALEMLALRRLPAATFSILMAMAPAVAALAGLVILGQSLGLAAWIGLGLVVVASIGAVLSA